MQWDIEPQTALAARRIPFKEFLSISKFLKQVQRSPVLPGSVLSIECFAPSFVARHNQLITKE